jgi:hypothetical protein
MTERLRAAGFWLDPDAPEQGLPDPRDAVDPDWETAERRRVIEYLRDAETIASYCGYSWCRFRCGIHDSEMGTCDLTDGAWVWPEGYAHYLEAHDVKPPDDFLEHVRARLVAADASARGHD